MNLLDNKGVLKSYVPLPESELGSEIKTRFEEDEEIMVSCFPYSEI